MVHVHGDAHYIGMPITSGCPKSSPVWNPQVISIPVSQSLHADAHDMRMPITSGCQLGELFWASGCNRHPDVMGIAM